MINLFWPKRISLLKTIYFSCFPLIGQCVTVGDFFPVEKKCGLWVDNTVIEDDVVMTLFPPDIHMVGTRIFYRFKGILHTLINNFNY